MWRQQMEIILNKLLIDGNDFESVSLSRKFLDFGRNTLSLSVSLSVFSLMKPTETHPHFVSD
jgi:hypothetical protein